MLYNTMSVICILLLVVLRNERDEKDECVKSSNHNPLESNKLYFCVVCIYSQ